MAGDLLVFLPTGVADPVVQKEFGGKTSAKVLVFDKMRDFEKSQKDIAGAAVVAPKSALEFENGYEIVLEGVSGGVAGEKWLLVASNPSVTAANVADQKIGVWNIMGRKNLGKFVAKYFGLPLKTKEVAKREDLLTMMGVDLVGAVIVSASDLEWMKKKTDMALRVISESKSPVGFLCVAVPKGGAAGDVQGLSKVSAVFLKNFAFDAWRAAK
jgi:hypothetical protein